jgi:DNA-binding winged helix-turn-helix (wHTH) protein
MSTPAFKPIYRFNGFTLDLRRRSLQSEGRDISLSPKEFHTLLLLVDAAGHAVEREAMISTIWPDTVVGDTSLARNISSLRRHIGPDAIEVVPKYGYRFALPVSAFTSDDDAAGQNTPLPQGMGSSPAPESAGGDAETAESIQKQEAIPSGDLTSQTKVAEVANIGWAKRIARYKLAIAVMAVVAAGVGVEVVKYLRDTAPTWTDPQTKLTWARRDNGSDVNREQAIAYCQNLDLAGHKDWRLPSIAEVQTLYDPALSVAGVWGLGSRHPRPIYWHVKGPLYLTGGTSASDLTFDTLQEQSYDFSYGRRNADPPDFPLDHRALCVLP